MGVKIIRDETLQGIADAIRSKTGTTEPIRTDAMAEAISDISGGGDRYDEGVAAGKKAEYDRFWDAYQQNGERTDYKRAFNGTGWTEDNFFPKYSLAPIDATDMFYNSAIVGDLRDYCELDTSKTTQYTNLFYGSAFTAIGTLELNGAYVGNAVYNMPNVESVELIVFSPAVVYVGSSLMRNCPNLKEVRFGGEWKYHNASGLNFSIGLNNLSKTSIESLINVLSLEASGLTCTISKVAVDREFETTEGANDGSTSDEWNALVATKPNWTISIV